MQGIRKTSLCFSVHQPKANATPDGYEGTYKWQLSVIAGLMGITPDGETSASIGTSVGVTGITPSSVICSEYDSATTNQSQMCC